MKSNPPPSTDNPHRIRLNITRESPVQQTARVLQMSGLFDLPPARRSAQTWNHDFTLPAEWNVGVIVGPSGAGKTTLAKEAFGRQLVNTWPWPQDKSILDGFPAEMGAREITGLLSSVGFSSPPSWLRPFHVLSNGEQFRVNVARALAETAENSIAVIDEFTSVVDRTVAQIGSAAVAKAVRRRKRKFVAVACHYDILDWLEPDWIYEPHLSKLTLSREGLWRRPKIELVIQRVDRSAWKLFKQHHYLSSDLNTSAACFVAFLSGQPAAFVGVTSFPHAIAPAWREHRAVCLPDFQGVGIGNAVSEFIASVFSARKRYISTTGHPAMIRHRSRSGLWRITRKPSMVKAVNGRSIANSKQHAKYMAQGKRGNTSFGRITAGFEYRGPVRKTDAAGFGILK